MGIFGVGVDVVDLGKFAASLERTPNLKTRLFTEAERGTSLESLAGRFAAKEALAKAMRAPAGLSWQDFEIVTDANGAPSFELHGQAPERIRQLGITAIHVSISHERLPGQTASGVASAFVVTEC